MKAKKILATVLALMMVISMLPVNALAATPGNTTSNRLKVELSASTTFGTTYDPDTPKDETDDIVVSTIAEYNGLNDNNGPEDIGGAVLSASNVATVGDSNIKLADQPFNGKLPDGFSGFSAGDTIYVGVKLRSENMDAAYHGIVAGMVLLKYDPTKLELLATNTDGIARNLAMIGFFNTSTKKVDRQGAKAYYCNASISDDSVFGAPGAGSDTGSNIINVSYSFPSDNNGRFPLLEKNTWDVVIPFKVKTGVKSGSSAIEVVKSASYNPGSGDTTAATYLESTDIAVDGDTKIVGSASNMNITAANNPDNCTLGKLTVDFTSSDPSASIPASSSIKEKADGQTLDVTLKNCTFASGAAAGGAATFEVWNTEATPAKVDNAVKSSAAKGSDNKVATVTIDGSKLTAGANYKIKVKDGKFTPATDPAGDLETGTFSVTAAPKPLTATFNYSNNQLSVTESVAWAWKLKSEADTAYHEVNSGANATLTEADLTTLRGLQGWNNNVLSDAIQVIAKSDTEKEAVANVSITKEATPTAADALELNFTAAQATAKANTDYEVKSGDNYVTTAVNVASGDTVTFRKAHGASSIASANATYKVPTAGTLTGITNTTTRDKKLLGQTTVGGVQATDTIKVGTGTASAAGGTTKDVAAEEGATITVTRPGTSGAAGTAQPSKTGTTTGVGFKKPTTLTVTKPSSTSADLKLAIPGGKGKFNSNAVVTVKADGSAVTGLTATLSDGTATDATLKGDDVITIAAPTGGWTEDKEYTVEVETTGTTPNLSAKFTTTFTVASAAGYTLKPSITDVTLSKDTFAAGESGTVTVTLGSSHDGKEIKTITGTGVSNADVKAGTFTYTAPSSVPAQQTDVTITITLGDIKYDALTYEETSVGHGSAISVAPKTKDARITDLKLVSVDPADKQGEFAVAADGTITVATPDNLTPNTTYTVTVGSTSIATYTGTATIKVGKAGATVTVANKFYDGTNAVPADKITVTADKGGATLDITITGATYDNANVGSGKAVSITGATISGADAANYTVNTSGITGEIEQLTGAQVKAETTTAAQVGSIADIVAAVKKQTVTIDGVTADLGTVADIVNDADGDGSNDDEIEGAVKAALNASGSAAVIAPGDQIEANVVEADASKASAAPIAVEQYAGGKITLTGIPEGATAAIKSGNATLTDGVLTGLTSETVVVTVTPETGDPYDVEIAVTAKADPTENVYDFTKLDATTLNITVSNLTGDITTNTDATEITVTLPITKKSSSSGGGYVPSTGYTVAIENTGYGSVDTTAITTDEDGKIVSLPTVTNVKKGVSFVGWSTNGQISGVIDPNTFRVQNDELTLTAVYQGYMAGYEDSTARPNKQITRAELLKMLIVATGDYDATKNYGTSTFTDVKNAWYVNYIACAQQSGKDIIAGYGDGTFKPNAPVTRNEAARMICQAFGVTVSEGDTTNKVNDFSKVAGWAQKYVAALCNNGTIHGYEDGEFKGDRAVTRGESAVMINGYLGLTDAAKEQLRNDPALKNIFKDMTDKQAWNFIDVLFAAMCAPASYYSDEITMPQA